MASTKYPTNVAGFPLVMPELRALPSFETLLGITKQCTRCNTIRPIADYPTHGRSKDGHGKICKRCKQPRAPRRKGKSQKATHKICPGCERTLPMAEFKPMEWREDKHDSVCRGCRPILKLEKGIGRWEHEVEITAEEVAACRLLIESRSLARAMGASHTLDWLWMLDHIEKWRCESSGRPLALKARGGQSPVFEPMIRMKDARRGFTLRNSMIVARVKGK